MSRKHKIHFCKRKLFFLRLLIIILALFLLLIQIPHIIYAQKVQYNFRNFDNKNIKILLKFPKVITTVRIQSIQNVLTAELDTIDKEYILNKPKSNENIPLFSKSDILQIQEGEDIVLQISSIGITIKTSEGIEPSYGFSKIKFYSNGIYNLEIYNYPPILLKGSLEISFDNEKNLFFVNEIKISDLIVCSVSELSPSPEIEANKAFIVAVRTKIAYLLQNKKHEKQYYDICNSSDCIVYNGFGSRRDLIEIIYNSMPELVMKTSTSASFSSNAANFQLFEPYMHECCGGKTSSAKEVFGKDDKVHFPIEDRISGKGAENCFHCPSFLWYREFSNEEISDFLSIEYAGGPNRVFWQFVPNKIDSSDRICEVKLIGRKEKNITGIEFLRSVENYFGHNAIKSMKFIIESVPRHNRIKGMGKGHGVGMCLFGADGLSKKGYKFDEILKFYYKNIFITSP